VSADEFWGGRESEPAAITVLSDVGERMEWRLVRVEDDAGTRLVVHGPDLPGPLIDMEVVPAYALTEALALLERHMQFVTARTDHDDPTLSRETATFLAGFREPS